MNRCCMVGLFTLSFLVGSASYAVPQNQPPPPTKPNPPANLTFNTVMPNVTGAYGVSWSSSQSSGANSYYLYRSKDSGPNELVATTSNTARVHTESGLAPGHYRYQVSACATSNYNSCSDPAASANNIVVYPQPSSPGDFRFVSTSYSTVAASYGEMTVNLGWATATGLTASSVYYISRTHNGGASTTIAGLEHQVNSYSETLSAVGEYSYSIVACATYAGGCSTPVVKTVSVLPLPSELSGLVITGSPALGDYGLQWNPTANASGYVVAASKNGVALPGYGIVTYLDGINTTHVSAQALSQAVASSGGTTDFSEAASYEFNVYACIDGGAWCGAASPSVVANVGNQSSLPAPASVVISDSNQNYHGEYTLSWTSVEGAQGYQIAASVDGNLLPGYGYLTYVAAATLSISSEALTEFYTGARDFSKPGNYEYFINPCQSQSQCSSHYGTASIAVQQLSAVTGFTVEDSDNGYALNWNASPEEQVSGYWVRASIGGIPFDVENNPPGHVAYINSDQTSVTSDQLSSYAIGIHDFEMPANYDFWIQSCTGLFTGNCASVQAHAVYAYNTDASDGVLVAPSPDVAAPPLTNDASVVASDKIGATAGEFRVDESGAATYTLPIAVPAGTAGVAPQMSLYYSSFAPNGLVGRGWSINGLSAITRCRQTLVHDNAPMPITWSDQDRFCLDGQRLVLESGAHYGASGSLYRTEIDSFLEVKAIGSHNGAPVSFEVRRKDGSLSLYGANAGARHQTSDGNHTMTWALSQFEDSLGNYSNGKGNFIEYHYAGNHESGHRIREIRYAFGTGNTHNARLVFNYESAERPDPIRGYVAGYQFSTTKRLDSIEVFNGAASVRRYELDYGVEPAEQLIKLSRLRSVRECSGSICLKPTEFSWVGPEESTGEILEYTYMGQTVSVPAAPYGLGFSTSPDSTTALENRDNRVVSDVKYPDINGDGLPDILWVEPKYENDGNVHDTKVNYAISDGVGFGPRQTIWQDSLNNTNYKVHVLDYNADGRQDVLLQRTQQHSLLLFLSMPGPQGWRLDSQNPTSDEGPGKIDLGIHIDEDFSLLVADFNSDGLLDLVYREAASESVGLIVRRALEPSGEGPSSNQFYSFSEAAPIDFNSATANASGAPAPVKAIDGRGVGADFNGDGRVDLITSDREEGPGQSPDLLCQIMVATDNGFDEYAPSSASPLLQPLQSGFYCAVQAVYPTDINADGLSDLLMQDHLDDWYYSLNTGTGFEPRVALAGAGETIYNQPLTLDYNQDGYPDVSWFNNLSNHLAVKLWQPESNDFGNAFDYQSTNGKRKQSRFFADMNGDGVVDYLHFRESTLDIYHGKGSHHPRLLVSKITNGLGAIAEIDYGALSTSGHYDRLEISTNTVEACVSTGLLQGLCAEYEEADSAAFYESLNSDWDASLPPATETLGKNAPVLELMAPVYVVNSVSSSAPLAGNPQAMSSVSYYYGEAKIQAAGRGMLGFETIRTVDEQTGLRTTTRYRQDFPFIGSPLSSRIETKEGQLLSESFNDYKAKSVSIVGSTTPVYQPFIASSEETIYTTGSGSSVTPGTLNVGAMLQQVKTDNAFDLHGNLLSSVATTRNKDGNPVLVKSTTNRYGESEPWLAKMGRLTHSTVSVNRFDGQPSRDRESSFSYFNSGALKGLLQSETVEPNESDYTLTTNYQYDAAGNRKRVVQTGSVRSGTAPTRVSEISYDTATGHRYELTQKNSMGQTTQWITARNTQGLPTQVLDINGVATNTSYGRFGRAYFVSSMTGASSLTLFKPCDIHCPTGASRTRAAYFVHTQQAGGAESKVYYDVLGREVRRASRLFAGGWAFVDINYDALGRVVQTTEPYRIGETIYTTQLSYDVLGRVISTLLPGVSPPASASYLGLTTIVENSLGQRKSEVRNELGELVDVYDHDNAHLKYEYDSSGNLTGVRHLGSPSDPRNVLVSMAYDVLGRKVSMNDPDKGYWEYEYNAFGELELQRDAKSQTSTMSYDAMGRMTRRLDRHGDGSLESDSRWAYNNALSGGGRAALEAVDDLSSGYSQTYGYDNLGRRSITTTQIEEGDIHCEKVTYDQFSRVFQNFDAGGDCSWTDSATQSHYNSYGYLEKVSDAVYEAGSPRKTYYKVRAMDARGNVTQAKHGNGVVEDRVYNPATGRLTTLDSELHPNTVGGLKLQSYLYSWDAIGNLTQRKNETPNRNLTENFQYDNLNRMTSSQIEGKSAKTQSYNSLGNITWKAGVGTYHYGTGATVRPHAVSYTGNGISYQYDANGNMKSDTSGRIITYSTFDKPINIRKAGHATSFKYSPGRSRYLRTDTVNNQETKTRYLGNVEKITRPDGVELIKRHLGNVVITITTTPTGPSQATHYLLKDHLGSLDVTTNSEGSDQKFYEFDAWGKRRGVNGLNLSPTALANFDSSITTRGYTGHEMLDQVGLIHMNGRVYDPHLGRFLQADPFVDGVTSTQGYNRYSYVHNNPLNSIDPTGFLKFGEVIQAIAVVAISVATYGAASYWAMGAAMNSSYIIGAYGLSGAATLAGVAGGAAAGFAAGVSMAAFGGATIGDALQAGARGAIAGAITGGVAGYFRDTYSLSRIAADGVGNGLASKITGGKFQKGLRIGLAISLATFTNVRLREYEIEHSMRTPGQIGESLGFRGVRGKAAGGRIVEKLWAQYGEPILKKGGSFGEALENYWSKVEPSLLGCHQGGVGCIVSEKLTYDSDTPLGRLTDYVAEGYAGPHDFANHWYHYNANGTAIFRQPGTGEWIFGEVLNWSNVAFVSPIVIPSLVPDYARFLFIDGGSSR